jgi:hypothetical protein
MIENTTRSRDIYQVPLDDTRNVGVYAGGG